MSGKKPNNKESQRIQESLFHEKQNHHQKLPFWGVRRAYLHGTDFLRKSFGYGQPLLPEPAEGSKRVIELAEGSKRGH